MFGQNILFGLKAVVVTGVFTMSAFLEKKCLSFICLKHLYKSTFSPKALTPLVGTKDSPLAKRAVWSLDNSLEEMFITVSICGVSSVGLTLDDRFPLLHFFGLLSEPFFVPLKKERVELGHWNHCRR